MATVEVWIEYASTYSYLTVARIGELARAHEVQLDWQPFWLPPVREQQGMAAPFPDRSSKASYMWQDVERRANKLGIPYQRPSTYPVNSLPTVRVALLAAREGWCQPFTEEVFRLHWTEGRLIGTDENMQLALSRIGKELEPVLARAFSPENKEALRTQTTKAIERGIFGSPSFVVERELFWGDDRLEEALERAAHKQAEQLLQVRRVS
jgi:2-hydroxychromene-2-carboxylate isomerase